MRILQVTEPSGVEGCWMERHRRWGGDVLIPHSHTQATYVYTHARTSWFFVHTGQKSQFKHFVSFQLPSSVDQDRSTQQLMPFLIVHTYHIGICCSLCMACCSLCMACCSLCMACCSLCMACCSLCMACCSLCMTCCSLCMACCSWTTFTFKYNMLTWCGKKCEGDVHPFVVKTLHYGLLCYVKSSTLLLKWDVPCGVCVLFREKWDHVGLWRFSALYPSLCVYWHVCPAPGMCALLLAVCLYKDHTEGVCVGGTFPFHRLSSSVTSMWERQCCPFRRRHSFRAAPSVWCTPRCPALSEHWCPSLPKR